MTAPNAPPALSSRASLAAELTARPPAKCNATPKYCYRWSQVAHVNWVVQVDDEISSSRTVIRHHRDLPTVKVINQAALLRFGRQVGLPAGRRLVGAF